MSSAAERLQALKKRLEEARDENLKAVEAEGAHVVVHDVESDSAERSRRSSVQKRERGDVDVGSADEADGERDDEKLRSMMRRARAVRREGDGEGVADDTVVRYGEAGGEDVDGMVGELQQVEKRRAKYRRRRAFDEDRADITFINEGNRLFNKALDKHFDKFESVKKIKDSLERGTA